MTTIAEAHYENERDTEIVKIDRLHVSGEHPSRLDNGRGTKLVKAKTINLNGMHVAHLASGTEIGSRNSGEITIVIDYDWHDEEKAAHVWVFLNEPEADR